MLFWRFGKFRVAVVLAAIFTASLAVAQWAAYSKPDAAFFLLPTRCWELLLGTFTALYLASSNRRNVSRAMRELGGWLGVALILFAVFTYSKATPFPGFYALVPTLGTALVILCVTKHTTTGKFLGLDALVGIGLISYSAYLWHQPLFVFARHKYQGEPSPVVFLALTALTFILAYFTWKLIETPFRKGFSISRRTVFHMSIFGSVFFLSFGYFGIQQNGFSQRFERVLGGDIGHVDFHQYIDEKYFDCEPGSVAKQALKWNSYLRCKQSKTGIPDVILLGDSHAEHLFLGLAESKPNHNVAFYILGGQPYVKNPQFKEIFDEILGNSKPQHMLLTMHFFKRVDESDTRLYDEFSSTIKALQSSGKNVFLLGDVPRFKQDPSYCVYSTTETVFSACQLTIAEWEKQSKTYRAMLRRLGEENRVLYLDVHLPLCTESGCSMSDKKSVLYRDNNHLNIFGSKLVGKYVADKLPF